MADRDPRSNPKYPPPRQTFVDEISGKSDRAVAIIGTALLNTHVDQLLSAFFINDPREIRALLGNDRPLGAFGARIRLAFLLGLIGPEERDDLWAVNQIRDFYIQDLGEMSFSDDPLREWCYSLRLPDKVFVPGETRTPRRLFVFTVALLSQQLALRIEQAEEMRREMARDFSITSTRSS